MSKTSAITYDQSKLFDRRGYISLGEYLADIDSMDEYGPWKLPLRLRDRLQFRLLKTLSRTSWFSPVLFVIHSSIASPAYALIIAYLKRQGCIDAIGEKETYVPGSFAYVVTRKVLSATRTGIMTGQGTADDKATALSKALGEIIERMVSGVHDQSPSVMTASPTVLIKKGIPILYPPKFHRYLDVQRKRYPATRHDPDIPLEWVAGHDLMSQQQVLIPKKLALWYIANGRWENMLAQATTNGVAGYFTKTGATLRAILEVVQRDGFLVHWLTMIPPRVIRNESLPEQLRKKVERFESFGVSIKVLDVTALGIPSVIIAGVSERSAKGPQVVLSGASALTFEEAISGALREMLNGLEMFYYPASGSPSGMEKNEPEPFLSQFGKIERQLYWRGAERVDHFRWFIGGPQIEYSEAAKSDLLFAESRDVDRLEKCLEVLSRHGGEYHPVVYFPKNKIQQDLGFHVVRVFIPKAFPLYLTEYLATYESDRLTEFVRARGVEHWTLNPYPHPFS